MIKEKKKLRKLKNTTNQSIQDSKYLKYWPFLLFIVAGLLLYGNIYNHDYNIDDEYVVIQNPVLEKGLKGIGEIFTSRYASASGNLGELYFDYRPVVKLSFALEFLLFGRNPQTSNVVNILLYIITAFCLYRLLRLMLPNLHYSFSVLATLLFMVHPTHTEVVASLKNRDEMLSFLFVIIAWFYVIKYGRGGKILHLVYAAAIYLLAYLSKSSALVFLAVFPLSLYFFTEMRGKKLLWVGALIAFIALAAQFGPRLFLPDPIRDFDFVENPLYGETGIFKRVATSATIMLFYLRMLFVPYPMLYYYGFDTIPVVGFANLWVWLSVLLHVAMLVVAVKGFMKRSIWSFIILFYFITLSIYSNLLNPVPGIVAVRFLYATSLAYAMAVVLLLYTLFRTDLKMANIPIRKLIGPAAIVVLLSIPYVIHTHLRNRAWKNIDSLYRTDVPRLPRSAKANAQYAGFIMNRLYTTPNFSLSDPALNFRTNQTIEHFKKAIDIYPDYFIAHNNLGTVYLRLKRDADSAAYHLKRAIQIAPHYTPPYISLGSLYRDQGNYELALQQFKKVIEIDPTRLRAMAEIAYIYNLMGEHDKAKQVNDELLEIDPNSELPFLYRGNYFNQQGNTELAVHFWQLAMEKRVHVATAIKLAEHYAGLRQFDRANHYYGLARQAQGER